MKKRNQLFKYLISDFLFGASAWFIFNLIRYCLIAQYQGFANLWSFMQYLPVLRGQIIIPLGWLVLHYYSGYYNQLFEKSRLSEFFTTFLIVFIGTITIFFVVLLKSLPKSFHIYYEQFFHLFFLSFTLIYLGRLFITSRTACKIQKRQWTINALILGNGKQAETIKKELEKPTSSLSYTIQGFIDTNTICPNNTDTQIPTISNLHNLDTIIEKYRTQELIIALDFKDSDKLLKLLYLLYKYRLPIKLPLHYFQFLSGGMRIKAISGVPLVDVTTNNFSEAEKNIKITIDKILSLFVLCFLSPIYIYLMIRIKLDSPGPIFFRQERIGYRNIPFIIYKFRTMIKNAEKDGPSLSFLEDTRVTHFGKKMRKYRLDELPQFWNVLKGDMSLIGPRPERKYYIDQIVKKAPHYYLLHNVRPGITSLGMVKFGYASNIQEMLERMQYDILYYENMSLGLDIKILIYTIKTIITGKGI